MDADTSGTATKGTRKAGRAILGSTVVTSALTVVSRVVGLVREQVRGYYLGTGMESDAFGIASTIPNMLRRLFAEGAMTAAFVPVFTSLRTDGDREQLSRFFSGFMTLFVLLMAGVTMLGVLAAEPLVRHVFAGRFDEVPGKVELTAGLAQVMFPYLFLVSVAAIVQATLNSFRIFGPSAFSPVLLSVVNIGAVVLFADRFENAAWALAVGFLAGGALQTAFQIPFLRGKGIRFRPTLAGFRDPAVRAVARTFLPGVFSAGIYQINVTVSQVIATSLDPGSVASLQYSLRMQELVLGVFAVSVATVVLPAMSEQAHEGRIGELKDTLRFSVGLLGFVTIPASAGLMLLATPIIELLFQYGRFDVESTRMTVFALHFHTAGIFFIAMQRNVVQVFYAQKDTKTPTVIAAVVMVAHVVLCYALAVPLRQGGIAAAGSIAAALNVALLYVVLRRRIGGLGTRALSLSLGRTLAATAAMAALVGVPVALGAFDGVGRWTLAWRLLGTIGAGIAVFAVAARLLRSEELNEFARLVRRRLRRTGSP
ncbi:MAG: murein biosynthesis integral membrane protein MurJ [Deltaproteobacteria bacterium]|nr:murein biosynthesis integral membrane protein MurJ [Deltaproteobacteria bacterium]